MQKKQAILQHQSQQYEFQQYQRDQPEYNSFDDSENSYRSDPRIQSYSSLSNISTNNNNNSNNNTKKYGSHSRLIASEDLSSSILAGLNGNGFNSSLNGSSSIGNSNNRSSRSTSTLVVENYTGQLPGYTGRRRI